MTCTRCGGWMLRDYPEDPWHCLLCGYDALPVTTPTTAEEAARQVALGRSLVEAMGGFIGPATLQRRTHDPS